jgi:hypothetical protein
MEEDADKKGLPRMASGHREKKDELQASVDNLKEVLFATQKIA